MDYSDKIKEECDSIKEMLVEKNNSYGNSVFMPLNIFGVEVSSETSVLARIADKLKRLNNLVSFNSEDSLFDLIGYLIILRIIRREKAEK